MARNQTHQLGIQDRLGLIGLINEGMRLGSSESPIVAELFDNLWDLVNTTVSGSKIDRLKPEESRNGFQVFEINAETGETLGRLNMLYLKKPLPCYYLVYVEVAPPFRSKGLGTRILSYFRDFLDQRSAVGILDNIIPREDPTYDIYFKQAWEPADAFIGDGILEPSDNYMIYVPPKLRDRDLKESILRLVHHIKRKRTTIDMRDNEVMVQRTITEFKDLYQALLTYFGDSIGQGGADPVMRFMFTRFVTKLIAFRRRISELLGYTGGESLGQINLDPHVAALPVQSYTPSHLGGPAQYISGDKVLLNRLPESLRENPAEFIENLPNYLRPNLTHWLDQKGKHPLDRLTIGDLMEIGFDPTRLKELQWEDQVYIFERVQLKQLDALDRKTALLHQLGDNRPYAKVKGARLKANPPVLSIRDRGNAYLLRHKVAGIHWEEAVEQLQTVPRLMTLDASANLVRIIRETVRAAGELIETSVGGENHKGLDTLAYFVSWDLEKNHPQVVVEWSTAYLETLWAA